MESKSVKVSLAPFMVPAMTTSESIECLDHQQGDCKGAVEYRFALSGTGRSFPRCDGHWAARLDYQDGINQRYGHPDSAVVPSDFEPEYAGERWDED